MAETTWTRQHNGKPFWESKKWWMAIIAAVVPLANGIFGMGLSVEQVATVVVPLAAYIVGQGIADHGRGKL